MRGARRIHLAGVVALTAAVLLAAACQVQRGPAPVGVALLRVGPPVRLTDRAALSPVAWSPDGRAVAYADLQGLWIHPLAGRERKITGVGTATYVSWSRVTGLIAYIDRGRVRVIRPDGSARRDLLLPGNGGPPFATHLAWAPGSDRLAVAVQNTRGTLKAGVWLASADGRFRRQILPPQDRILQIPPEQAVAVLEWFPDSLYLLIGLGPEEGTGVTRLFRWRITYPDHRLLPQPDPRIFLPHLSPDARWIAYVAPGPAGKGQVWARRIDGGSPRRLSDPGRISGLAWAPTADKVAYARVLDEAHGEVWLADVDGGGRLRVAQFVAEFPDPNLPLVLAWSGDGRHLAYGSNSGSYKGPVWVVGVERR